MFVFGMEGGWVSVLCEGRVIVIVVGKWLQAGVIGVGDGNCVFGGHHPIPTVLLHAREQHSRDLPA